MLFLNKNSSVEQGRFVFENFILTVDGVLIRDKKRIKLPPKEFSVLSILLESAGKIVGKDDLLDLVWGDADITEESLTRCIYALRKILSTGKDNRYIETIYGKGYRFNQPVVSVSKKENKKVNFSIAILPFQANAELDTAEIHNNLIKGIFKYSKLGLTVLPSVVTQHCNDVNSLLELTNKLKPDYYLAGKIITSDNGYKVTVELISTEGHCLLHHDSFNLLDDQLINLLQNWISNIILQNIPELQVASSELNSLNSLDSLDSATIYLNGIHMLYKHTSDSLQQAIILFKTCINRSPDNILAYYSLAETYLCLAQFGFFDKQKAINYAYDAIAEVTKFNNDSPRSLGLLGLIKTIKSDFIVGETLLKQALLIGDGSADINYYYGWHLYLKGELSSADKYFNRCLDIMPTRTPVSILKLWITYCTKSLDESIAYCEMLLSQNLKNNPVLNSMLALFLSLNGDFERAKAIIDSNLSYGENCGFVEVNVLYSKYCMNKDSEIENIKIFLKENVDDIPKAILLPLILVAEGKSKALDLYAKLKNENNIWLNLWGGDPRIISLKNSLDG
ncbi:TPA: HilA/EilA family virulence transcriptional regulator [Providencia rettgeri]